jgi:hypothetical protein
MKLQLYYTFSPFSLGLEDAPSSSLSESPQRVWLSSPVCLILSVYYFFFFRIIFRIIRVACVRPQAWIGCLFVCGLTHESGWFTNALRNVTVVVHVRHQMEHLQYNYVTKRNLLQYNCVTNRNLLQYNYFTKSNLCSTTASPTGTFAVLLACRRPPHQLRQASAVRVKVPPPPPRAKLACTSDKLLFSPLNPCTKAPPALPCEPSGKQVDSL